MLHLTLFTCTPPCLNKIRELHCWRSLLIHRSYMELSYLDRHILGEDWINVVFFFCIIHLPTQPQHFQEKKNPKHQLCSTPVGVGLLACCGHTFHLCIFLKKGGRNGYCHAAKHIVFWKLCRMSQLKWHQSTLYEGTDLQLSAVPVLFQVEDRTLCNVWRSLDINHHMKNMLFFFSEGKKE